jgi:cytochrome c biogenesis protein
MSAWTGDLGLDSGAPQSIYKLDTTKMTRIGLEALRPGQTWKLENGAGTIRFDGYDEFATFAVAHDPGKGLALVAVIIMISGLMLSLGIRRRRVWVRAELADDGRTVVTVGALGRTEAAPIEDDVETLMQALGDTGTGTKELAKQ